MELYTVIPHPDVETSFLYVMYLADLAYHLAGSPIIPACKCFHEFSLN